MTKRETALALLRQGATLQAIIDATGWTKGTASNWLAEIRRTHILGTFRHRCVGPNNTGAKGSYTIYSLKGDENNVA
jgi:hypothetical protein